MLSKPVLAQSSGTCVQNETGEAGETEPVPHDAKPKEDLRYGKAAGIPSSHFIRNSRNQAQSNGPTANERRGFRPDDSLSNIDVY